MKVGDFLIAKDNIVRQMTTVTYKTATGQILERKAVVETFEFKKDEKYLISKVDETLKLIDVVYDPNLCKKATFSLFDNKNIIIIE